MTFSMGLSGSRVLSLSIPPDKSISHRALFLAALSDKKSRIEGLLKSEDVLTTEEAFKQLGVRFEEEQAGVLWVYPPEGQKLQSADSQVLDCRNSGTTLRLLCGALAGQRGLSPIHFKGDASLSRRPVRRVIDPLTQMGAIFRFQDEGVDHLPFSLVGSKGLHGIEYELPIASAQVKSALLLATLRAEGVTLLTGRLEGRDHTERWLPVFGASLFVGSDRIEMRGNQRLHGASVCVPGDFSSAAFWMTAALLTPGAELELKRIGLNPTRTGFLDVIRRMGARVEVEWTEENPEPVGTVRVWYSALQGVEVGTEEVPRTIDEFPLIAILATRAEGETRVRGAEELRLKETDRLANLQSCFQSLGLECEIVQDGFWIRGPQQEVKGGRVDPQGDHRLAMAFSILGLASSFPVYVIGSDCVEVSYPDFYSDLNRWRETFSFGI